MFLRLCLSMISPEVDDDPLIGDGVSVLAFFSFFFFSDALEEPSGYDICGACMNWCMGC